MLSVRQTQEHSFGLGGLLSGLLQLLIDLWCSIGQCISNKKKKCDLCLQTKSGGGGLLEKFGNKDQSCYHCPPSNVVVELTCSEDGLMPGDAAGDCHACRHSSVPLEHKKKKSNSGTQRKQNPTKQGMWGW